MNLLRALIAFVLALALTVIAALFVLSLSLKFSSSGVFITDNGTIRAVAAVFLLLLILCPLITLLLALRRRSLSWRRLLIGWLIAVPVLVWLCWDDAELRHPLTIEALSPVQPGDEQSEAVLMQYSKLTPSAEAKAFAERKLSPFYFKIGLNDETKLRAYVAEHRAEIEADWVALEPQRRWLDELNGFERIGDLMPSRIDANLMSYNVWRTLSVRIRAKATLLAIDRRNDEAIATLLPFIAVSQRLQQNGRSLVRVMIANSMERTAWTAVQGVLEHGTVSTESRTRLAALLKNPEAEKNARCLLLLEYAHFSPMLGSLKLGGALALQRGTNRPWVVNTLNYLSPLFINPNATMNRYGEQVFVLADLAARRELAAVSAQIKAFDTSLVREGGMKNIGGRLLLAASLPNYDKVLETYWQTADLRAALLAKVTQP